MLKCLGACVFALPSYLLLMESEVKKDAI